MAATLTHTHFCRLWFWPVWRLAMVDHNVLQARNTVSALPIGRLVRQRLEPMKPNTRRRSNACEKTVIAC